MKLFWKGIFPKHQTHCKSTFKCVQYVSVFTLALTAQIWQPWWWRPRPGPAVPAGLPFWPAAAPGSAGRTPAGPTPRCNTGTRSVKRGRGLGKVATHQPLSPTEGVSAVTRRPATWSRWGSAPPAPACPAETPPCPAASDTGSTWRWGRGSHTGWPAGRRIGRESGECLEMQISTPPRFRHPRIWGSPPSPSPQEAAPLRWTQRHST